MPLSRGAPTLWFLHSALMPWDPSSSITCFCYGQQHHSGGGGTIHPSQRQGCVDVLGKVFPNQKHWTTSLPCLTVQNEPKTQAGCHCTANREVFTSSLICMKSSRLLIVLQTGVSGCIQLAQEEARSQSCRRVCQAVSSFLREEPNPSIAKGFVRLYPTCSRRNPITVLQKGLSGCIQMAQ